MGLSRRGFVRILGGGAVFAATAGIGLATCDRMPGEAVEGWAGPPPGETDPRRRALSYALLAPSPHNRQAWLADLGTPGQVRLFVDPERMLPMTDPDGRQVLIGCGCFLEMFVLAAAADGWRTSVRVFDEGFDLAKPDAHPFAAVALTQAEPADPGGLAAAILRRRSAKVDYDGRPLGADHAAALRGVHRDGTRLDLTSTPDTVTALRRIACEAMRVEVNTDRTWRESVELMRVGAGEIARHRDGLTFHGPFFWWAKTLGLMTPEAQMAPDGTARETGRTLLDAQAASTATFGWLATAGNRRAQQIEAGRAYVRVNLAATAAGVAMAPWSQALQEFPEMAALRRELHATVGAAEDETVQMFFRLGYAAAVPPTPRRPLTDILRA